MDTSKVVITLNNDLIEKIDTMAKSIGTSRSSLCAVWIGQTVYGYDKLFEQTNDAIKTIANTSKDDK